MKKLKTLIAVGLISAFAIPQTEAAVKNGEFGPVIFNIRESGGQWGMAQDNLDYFVNHLHPALARVERAKLDELLAEAPALPAEDTLIARDQVTPEWLSNLVKNTHYALAQNMDGRKMAWGRDNLGNVAIGALAPYKNESIFGQKHFTTLGKLEIETGFSWLLVEAAHTWGYGNAQAKIFANSMLEHLNEQGLLPVYTRLKEYVSVKCANRSGDREIQTYDGIIEKGAIDIARRQGFLRIGRFMGYSEAKTELGSCSYDYDATHAVAKSERQKICRKVSTKPIYCKNLKTGKMEDCDLFGPFKTVCEWKTVQKNVRESYKAKRAWNALQVKFDVVEMSCPEVVEVRRFGSRDEFIDQVLKDTYSIGTGPKQVSGRQCVR